MYVERVKKLCKKQSWINNRKKKENITIVYAVMHYQNSSVETQAFTTPADCSQLGPSSAFPGKMTGWFEVQKSRPLA